jgi:molybdate transport repressor ModE-like protein
MVSKESDKLVWDDLRFFAEIAQQGSLSAAARVLGVDHATVGRRLQRLEAMLGRPLFDRRNGGFELTADGREVLVHAEAMDKAALAVARFGAGAPALSGTIRLTATEALASHYLTPRLAEFQALHPDIDVALLTDDRNLSVARREADLALRLALPADGELTARRLTGLGYGLYAAADKADEGAQDRYVDYAEDHDHLPETGWLRQLAPSGRIVFRSNSLRAQAEAIAAGTGWGLLPHYLARGHCTLRLLPCDISQSRAAPSQMTLSRELWLLVHRDLRNVPRIRLLIDYLADCCLRDRTLLEG